MIYEIQCNLDLVTPYLVTNPDLVTILQMTIFLVHNNISFSDKNRTKRGPPVYVLQLHLCIYLAWRLLPKYVNKSYFDDHWI